MAVVIAIDYEDTFTADAKVWKLLIAKWLDRGHVVVCCTDRNAKDPVADFPGEVYYTNGLPKEQFMADAGVPVDIWLDDFSDLIGNTKQGIWIDDFSRLKETTVRGA